MKKTILFISVLNLLVFSSASGQEDFNHPELEWKTIETKHFLVHFHNGAERTGNEVAKIAESIYDPITKMYSHEPDQKVSFVIRDHDDYSNGGAYFYDNKIVIYAPALDFELRGTHPWLWNVVTHEFTHIVQIQTAMKFGRKIPGIYFQWLGYEKESRPDVLYGYPNVIVSYPISGFLVPPWFAEGVAQYNNPVLGYDTWDSHRDMILRMYMLDGTPLSWNEMAFFGKNSLGNESVYNAGFSLVGYIGQKYGVDKLQAISRQLSVPFRLTIDGAIEAVLGKTGIQLYDEWKAEKMTGYKHLADSLKPTLRDGALIEKEGFGNFYPVFSPDGSKIAYVSNKATDYFSTSSIYVYDIHTKTSKQIVREDLATLVRSALSFSPDTLFMYYAQITRENPHWSGYSDLYRFNLSSEKEERLTHGLRAINPKLSQNGKRIVFATDGDGTMNIGVCDADGKNISRLTKFQNGEQVYTPVWSTDGSRIAFGYSTGHNQSVALIDSNGSNFQVLIHAGDCRNPFFASDSTLFYSWDKGGIFNIYSLNLRTGIEQQITNVLGGAFLPCVNDKGDVAFVDYTSGGYKIALLPHDTVIVHTVLTAEKDSLPAPSPFSLPDGVVQTRTGGRGLPAASVHPHNETSPQFQAKPYHSVFTSISIVPLLRIDTYNKSSRGIDFVKPGLYVTSSDVLDKMSIFGGADINRKLERDLFLILAYSDRLPILYPLGLEPTASLELYNITRKRDVSFDLYINSPQTFNAEITYNLFEFDFSLKQKIITENAELKLAYSLSRYSQDFGSWFHPLFGVIPATGSTYLIGNTIFAQFKYDGILRTLDKDINPIGRSFSLKYIYEMDKFNPTDSSSTASGFRVPIYTNYNFSRLELLWNEHFALPLPRHTFSLTLNASSILGPTIDEFFDYYAGGFIGMRGYPFYAIGGNKAVTLNASYRFPIATQLDFRVLQFYFSKLYASVFYDIGNAWPRETSSDNFWKRDVGFEIRLESFSFYSYPTRIFFSGAYGLDQFSRTVNDINITNVTYGHEWRFYLGVLFGFELNDIMPRQFMR